MADVRESVVVGSVESLSLFLLSLHLLVFCFSHLRCCRVGGVVNNVLWCGLVAVVGSLLGDADVVRSMGFFFQQCGRFWLCCGGLARSE